jgi:hypothetical protein
MAGKGPVAKTLRTLSGRFPALLEVIPMSIGEALMRESTVRVRHLRQASQRPGRLRTHLMHWGAWLNYLLSVIVLTAGITAGWRFAEIGFGLMMNYVSGEEVQQRNITNIPAWILAYREMTHR